MRVVICLIACALSLQTTHAQLLLTQQDNNIALHDLAANNVFKLSTGTTGQLSGYRISNDSIVCYMNNNGVITEVSFAINQPIPKVRSADYIQQIRHDTSVTISPTEKLTIDRGNIWLYVEGLSRWKWNGGTVSIDPRKTGLLYVGAKWGFIVSYSKIYQADFKTGAEKFLTKGAQPCYSPDGLFILYKNAYKEEYRIIPEKGKATTKHSFSKAFWVYEKI